MNCRNCGNLLNPNERFCGNCGAKVENIVNPIIGNNNFYQNYPQQNFNNQNNMDGYPNIYLQQNNGNKSRKSNTALIIGIISLVLVFFIQIFTMPLSIVGIVFGILSIKENKKDIVGLILNIISLVLAIPILIFYTIIFDLGASKVKGVWDCKGYNTSGSYTITMRLEENDDFIWAKYNDEKNNYASGKYELTDLYKTNNDGSASYYSIKLNVDKIIENGLLTTGTGTLEYEMGYNKSTDEAILMNVKNYNMYYCKKR